MLENVLLIGLAFALGGILKGATGAGAPLLAIPILALLYDVPIAITLFAIPNLVPNVWQAWRYRAQRLPTRFWLQYAAAGGVGAAVGTYGLATINSDYLLLVVALVVVAYIVFRTFRPGWVLAYSAAQAVVAPVGFIAGILQGAGGISAPVSITFLNAMKLDRGQFIATISVFFTGIALVQVPLLFAYGFMTSRYFAMSCAALAVVMAFMPIGSYLARRIAPKVFERIILVLLAVLSLKMILQVLLG